MQIWCKVNQKSFFSRYFNFSFDAFTFTFNFRAKTIKNKATANVEKSAAELQILLDKALAEIERLRAGKGLSGCINLLPL